MITPIAATARRRRASLAAVVTLATAGLLAAGCATASSTANGAAAGGASASPTSTGQAPAGSASAVPTAPAAGGSNTPGGTRIGAAPAPTGPVPTVSGGSVAPGQPACAGWPSKAPTASLPVSFVPVSVERCVNGAQAIKGKGLWVTATLQRADGNLTALINALHSPAAGHKPGTACPALAMIPPQVVLTDASGKQLIPRLPSTGCGLIQSKVLVALNALSWHPVSVRLISQVPDGTSSTVTGSPRTYQTVGGVAPQ